MEYVSIFILMLIIMVLFIAAWVIIRINNRRSDSNSNSRQTILVPPQPVGYLEKCPYCGFVIRQSLEVSGQLTHISGSSSTSMKVNGKEVCPNCGKSIKRTHVSR